MDPLQIVGMKDLDDDEKATLQKLANEYREKFAKQLGNDAPLIVHVKNMSKGGRKKYDVHVRLMAPTHIFESSYVDWEFPKTLHHCFNAIEHQLQHKLHVNSQGHKTYE